MSGARLRVAVVSPWPPVRCGIADFASELLPALRGHVDLAPYAPEEARVALEGRPDVLLLHVGNDPLHAPTVELLRDRPRRLPAVVVLHDFCLHHLFAAAYLDRGREDDYARELGRAHGERGRLFARRSLAGPRIPVWDLDPWAFPMSAAVIRDATSLLVHSRLVRGAVLREVPGARVLEVPLHVVPAPRTPRAEARAALGLPATRTIVATLGFVTPAKRLDRTLRALALLPAERRPFLFVGGAVGDDDPLHAAVAELGLEGDVRFGGYLDDADFWRAASAGDVALNLRYPTMGETSGAVCRIAGFGLPLVVSDVGWFRELPGSFARKVPVGEGEVEAIAAALDALGSDPEARSEAARSAVAWGEARRPEEVARRYAAALREAADGLSAPRSLPARLASELFALGVGRPGRYGAAGRGPDAQVVVAAAASAAGIVPSPSGE